MSDLLERVRDQLGHAGMAAALLLAGVAAFHFAALRPLAERYAALEGALVTQARSDAAAAPGRAAASRIDSLYRTLERPEQTPDWLARLYSIGEGSGLGLRTATYAALPTVGRLERFEIVLPMSGSYAQIREFVAGALSDIPVLSIDRLTLVRAAPGERTVQAELRLTLHGVKK